MDLRCNFPSELVVVIKRLCLYYTYIHILLLWPDISVWTGAPLAMYCSTSGKDKGSGC